MSVLTREMIACDLDGSWECANRVVLHCERISEELYPAFVDTPRAEIAEKKLFLDCYAISQGHKEIPEALEVDQLEDWLAACAVKTVCEIERARTMPIEEDPTIRTLDAEYALHGYQSPHEAGHRGVINGD